MNILFDYYDDIKQNYRKYYSQKAFLGEMKRIKNLPEAEKIKKWEEIRAVSIGNAISLLGINKDYLEQDIYDQLTYSEDVVREYDENVSGLIDFFNQKNSADTKYAGVNIITNVIGKTTGKDFMKLLRNALMHGKATIRRSNNLHDDFSVNIRFPHEGFCKFEADIPGVLFSPLAIVFYGQRDEYSVLRKDKIRLIEFRIPKQVKNESELLEILNSTFIHEHDVEYNSGINEPKRVFNGEISHLKELNAYKKEILSSLESQEITKEDADEIVKKIFDLRSFSPSNNHCLSERDKNNILNIIINYYPEFYKQNGYQQEKIINNFVRFISSPKISMADALDSIGIFSSAWMFSLFNNAQMYTQSFNDFRRLKYHLHMLEPTITLSKLYNLIVFIIENKAVKNDNRIDYSKLDINCTLNTNGKEITKDSLTEEKVDTISHIRNAVAHGNVEIKFLLEDVFFDFKNINRGTFVEGVSISMTELNNFIDQEAFKELICDPSLDKVSIGEIDNRNDIMNHNIRM